jgi:predicted site-specific integrase-resolvase
MPVEISGQVYYRTSEVCQKTGVSRATLFRWFKTCVIEDAEHRDRKEWRLFTEDDLKRIQAEASKIKNRKREPDGKYDRGE